MAGLLTSRRGEDMAAVCRAFAQAGYLFGPLLIDAARFLPQSRPRLFVVGVRPECTAGLPVSEAPVPAWHGKRMVQVRAALEPAAQAQWRWWNPPEPPPRTLTLADVLEPDEAASWHTPAQTERFVSQMQPPSLRRLTAARLSSGRQVGALYRRTRASQVCAEVRFDGLSGCLRGAGGGSSRQVIVVTEGPQVRTRLLTPREGARLMGLPDTYHLPGRVTEALQVVGDGVAVPVVRFLLGALVVPACAPGSPVSAP